MWKRLMLIGSLVVLAVILGAVVSLSVLSWTARRPENLGVKDGKLAACSAAPNCVSSQAEDAEHGTEPLRFTDAPGIAWARAVRIVTGLPRVNVVTVDDTYMHAEVSSALFRFVDDVELVLDAGQHVIHVRSASRVGHSDLGANRQRIEAIRDAWGKAD